MIGFRGHAQIKIEVTSEGYAENTSAKRYLGNNLVVFRNGRHRTRYKSTNTGTAPNSQRLLSDTEVTFSLLAEVTIPTRTEVLANANDVRANFYNGGPTLFRGYVYNGTGALSSDKVIQLIFNRPDLIKHLSFGGFSGSGSGSYAKGVLTIANFINLRTIYLVANSTSQASTKFTSIVGAFPRLLKGFHFAVIGSGGTKLTSIQYKFPKGLQHLVLGSDNSTLAAQVNTLISDCIKLKSFLLTEEDWVENGTLSDSRTKVSGTLTIPTQDSPIEYFSMVASTVTTDISFTAGLFTGIKKILFRANTAIPSSKFLLILNECLTSVVAIWVNLTNNSLAISRSLADSDIKSTLQELYLYGNKITGSIMLTAAKVNLLVAKFGDSGSNVATADKHVHTTVDISGLTNSTLLDISNALVEFLTLPVNTVCQTLSIGGNKLNETNNPSLISQIAAMTGLQNLRFHCVSVSRDNNNAIGQEGVGLFTNANFSTLTNLLSFWGSRSGFTGSLTLPNKSFNEISVPSNSLTSLVGSFSIAANATSTFCAANNPSLNLDSTKFHNARFILIENCGIVTLDLSGRTTTLSIGDGSGSVALRAYGCSQLTTVIFSTTSGRALIGSSVAGNISLEGIQLRNSPLLTSIQNLEFVTWVGISSAYAYILNASSCALSSQDFKLGTNSNTPTNIYIQDNAMTNSAVDLNINTLFTNRRKYDAIILIRTCVLNIAGTNAATTGTYQAPSGYKSQTITGITKAATAVATVSAIGSLVNNDVIRIRSVVGMTQVNNQYYMIKNISGNTFELYDETGTTPVNSTAFTTYTSGGLAQVEGTPASAKEQIYILVNVYQWSITYN